MKRVLCIDIANWIGVERLAIHLVESGFIVGCLCKVPSILNMVTGAVCHHWGGGAVFGVRLEEVIAEFRPDLLIFMDDASIRRIGRLIINEPEGLATRHRLLLERSLGQLDTVWDRALRCTLTELGTQVNAPKTVVSTSLDALAEFGASVGWQAFFKEEFTCNGAGVTATRSERQFLEIATGLLDENVEFVVQEAMPGLTAMRAAVAHEGRVICGASFKKVAAAADGIGYSTVITPVQHAGMQAITEKVAGLLKIGGPFSCDFILDDATGAASLIEINPRPTTIFHLGCHCGVSFADAFAMLIDGVPQVQQDTVPEGREITLFPKELYRDPKSLRLTAADHDVPWSYPGVVAHYISRLPETT